MVWKARSFTLTFDRPIIMGIINLTTDSFFEQSRFENPKEAVRHAVRLVQDGADLLDLGAESTRPGAPPVSKEEELGRLLPVLEVLRKEVAVPISIDTTKAEVARQVLSNGADIINDVSGFRQDPLMGSMVKEFGAGVVLMHRRGTPITMRSFTQYHDVMAEVIQELEASLEIAASFDIPTEQIVLDPGIGFSKTAEQSLEIIERLGELKGLGRPILVGPSRKSFIGVVTKTSPERRLFGTVASCVLALERGADLFRVHDVWALKEALTVAWAVLHSEKKVLS